MMKLKVNGVAKGQYKQLCPLSWHKCKGNKSLLIYKIRRAADLGKEVHIYSNNCKIIRYYYLNILVSEDEIMTIWKDETRQPFDVSEYVKQSHKETFYHSKRAQLHKVIIVPPLKEDLTETGFNKNIKIDQKQTVESLLGYGFTNYNKPNLFYSRNLGDDISFSVTVDKATLEITRIDVLDERFCQPYNYQSILYEDSEHNFALNIYHKVNGILGKLQDDEIITGFEIGMYI